MLRHRLSALPALFIVALSLAAAARAQTVSLAGPTRIYLVDADSVFMVAAGNWQSTETRNQEKLLRYSLRLRYWRDHLPGEMRQVFDALGYPTGRVLLRPVGHEEEWWYYGQLQLPLRFRDGVLLDRDRLAAMSRLVFLPSQ
jgi:hypothetical protein